jgi:hypothetical protein
MAETGWPRIKRILDNAMQRWQEASGREPKLAITHEGHVGWETKKELAESNPYGKQLIESDKVGNGRAEETNLIRILRGPIGGFRRMPSRGPYLSRDEIREIADWIDAGLPD